MCNEAILLNQSAGFAGHISYTPHLQALNTAMIIHEQRHSAAASACAKVKDEGKRNGDVQIKEEEDEEVKFVEKGWWSAPADAEKLREDVLLNYRNEKQKQKRAKEKRRRRRTEISSEEKPVSSCAEKRIKTEAISEENSGGSVEESSSGVGPSTTSGADDFDTVQRQMEIINQTEEGGGHAFHVVGNRGLMRMDLRNGILFIFVA
jgi:hypothetical protein